MVTVATYVAVGIDCHRMYSPTLSLARSPVETGLTVLLILVLGVGVINNRVLEGLPGVYLLILMVAPFLLLLSFLRLRNNGIISRGKFAWLALGVSLFALWLYGIIIGVWNNNPLAFILRNNAGMFVYILILPLIIFLTPKRAVRILYASGVLVMLATLIIKTGEQAFGIEADTPWLESIFGPIVGAGGVRWGRVFFYTQYLVCVPLCVSFARLLNDVRISEKMRALFVFLPALYVTIIVSMSKGIQLAVLFSLIFSLCVYLCKGRWKTFWGLIIPGVLMLLMGYVGLVPNNAFAKTFFSADDVSNLGRFEQVRYLVESTTWVGQGLGATIEGYRRAEGLEYGFELSYLALFHKFGILGLLLLFAYAWTLLSILQQVQSGRLSRTQGVALGAGMSFLMPAIGNPGLFSVQEVVTHTVIMAALANAPRSGSPQSAENSTIRKLRLRSARKAA